MIMTKTEAMNILAVFDRQVVAKSDGAHQTLEGLEACEMGIKALKKWIITEADLKHYLRDNEENGVVYVPKFIIEKLLN